MGWYVTETSSIDQVATQWKWSGEERARAKFIAENAATKTDQRFNEMLVEGVPLAWVVDLMKLNDQNPAAVTNWPVPKMPVSGGDLMKLGVKPGPPMGAMLKQMSDQWKRSGFEMTREQLLAAVPAND
jgi:hypothetical protein